MVPIYFPIIPRLRGVELPLEGLKVYTHNGDAKYVSSDVLKNFLHPHPIYCLYTKILNDFKRLQVNLFPIYFPQIVVMFLVICMKYLTTTSHLHRYQQEFRTLIDSSNTTSGTTTEVPPMNDLPSLLPLTPTIIIPIIKSQF